MVWLTRAKRAAASLWFIILMVVAFIAAFMVQVAASIITYPFITSQRRTMMNGHIFRKLSMLSVSSLNPFWSVRRIGTLPTPPAKAIIMCNHLSNADPFVLCKLLFPWEAKYIAKSILFRVPIAGWCMSLAGDLPVHFTPDKGQIINHSPGGWGVKKGSVGPMMEQARSYINNGTYIAAFPEGVRSPTGELQEFKDGLFRLACDTGAAIIPMALTGTNRGWPLHEWLLDTATMVGIVGEPIPSTNLTPSQLKDRVRIAMTALKVKLPAVPQPRYSAQQRRAMRPSVDVPMPTPIDDTVDAMLAAIDNGTTSVSSGSSGVTVTNPARSVRQTPPVPIRPLVPSLPPPHGDSNGSGDNNNNMDSPQLSFDTPVSTTALFKTANNNNHNQYSSYTNASSPSPSPSDMGNTNSNTNTLSVPRRNLVTSILPITPPHNNMTAANATAMAAAVVHKMAAAHTRSSPSLSIDDTPTLTVHLPALTDPSPTQSSSLSSLATPPRAASSSSSSTPLLSSPLYYQHNIVPTDDLSLEELQAQLAACDGAHQAELHQLNTSYAADRSSLRHRLVASETADTGRDARRTALEPELQRRRVLRDQQKTAMREWEQRVDASRSETSRIAEEKAAVRGQQGDDSDGDDHGSGNTSSSSSPRRMASSLTLPAIVDSPRSGSGTSGHTSPSHAAAAGSSSHHMTSSLLPSLADEDMNDFDEEDAVLLVS